MQIVATRNSDQLTHFTMSKRYAKYQTEKLIGVIRGRSGPKAVVHSPFINSGIKKTIKNQGDMVGGTGIEPVTSGL
jgi:hypothetical protein